MKRFHFGKKGMFHKLFLMGITCWMGLNCNPMDDGNDGVAQYHREFTAFYSLFFIVPDLDFNQFCPPTDQIPILEPGTYSRFMQVGDTYLFDNRARLNALQDTYGSSKFFTFTIQESTGQEIRLVSPYCRDNPNEYSADDDSGMSGQLETVSIDLTVPPLPQKRLGFFTKLKALSGSGTITFTTPSAPDPPH
nr:LIC_10705 family lipoprotein [Leptospira kmetyi]